MRREGVAWGAIAAVLVSAVVIVTLRSQSAGEKMKVIAITNPVGAGVVKSLE